MHRVHLGGNPFQMHINIAQNVHCGATHGTFPVSACILMLSIRANPKNSQIRRTQYWTHGGFVVGRTCSKNKSVCCPGSAIYTLIASAVQGAIHLAKSRSSVEVSWNTRGNHNLCRTETVTRVRFMISHSEALPSEPALINDPDDLCARNNSVRLCASPKR